MLDGLDGLMDQPIGSSKFSCYHIHDCQIWNYVANVIKLFTAVNYDFSKKARAFVTGKPLQPSLMFVVKAWSLP